MNKLDYDQYFNSAYKPSLLLHSCCAPCSSYCLVYMRRWFDITCFYYNPNITDRDEYEKRSKELERLVEELNNDSIYVKDGELILNGEKPDFLYLPIKVITSDFDPKVFTDAVVNGKLQDCPERGERCSMCFTQRLSKTYEVASQKGFDYFATTLTLSPLKNAELINKIGETIGDRPQTIGDRPQFTKARWLYTDFKKKNGYKISIDLSKRYNLYRQNYCGCEYSKRNV